MKFHAVKVEFSNENVIYQFSTEKLSMIFDSPQLFYDSCLNPEIWYNNS